MTDSEPLPPVPEPLPETGQPEVLPYARVTPARPGVLTAVGVLSIIFGSLGILANACAGLEWSGFAVMRAISFPAAPSVATPQSATTNAAETGDVGPVEVEEDTDVTLTNPPTTMSANAGTATASFTPFASMALWPLVLSATTAVGEMALGGYLLFAGIQLIRNRASSIKHHLRYVWIKIPVTIIAAIAAGLAIYEFQRSIFTMGLPGQRVPSALPVYAGMMTGGISLLFSLAYPVAVLIVLTRPRIREYAAEMH